MSSEGFYRDLPVQGEFGAIARVESYAPLPDDWQVLVSDLEGSTAAIAQGRYRDVNLLGASSIMAVINAVKPVQVPYVFGGDGASLAVPGTMAAAAGAALLATSEMARDKFGLTMRVGAVPVGELAARGQRVLVAKVRVSDEVTQAAFTGGGLQLAERLVKDAVEGQRWRLDSATLTPRGDFKGLECRWNSIPSPHGEVVTLLVEAGPGGANSPADEARIYREVISEIERIYGRDEVSHPVREAGLNLTLRASKLGGEATLRAGRRGWLVRGLWLARIMFETAMGKLWMRWSIRAMGVPWGQYKRDVMANTDRRKFDDRLRQVLSGTPAQRQELEAWLEARYRRGELVYGLHAAATATMTCLVFERSSNQHVHFIDGSDGGYALAATELKRRLREQAARSI